MKTITAIAACVALIGAVGYLNTPEKKMYTADFTVEIPPMNVQYASSDEGAINHWLHCGVCLMGVIRPDGKCSHCGKGIDEQPKD
jgi:hypothetical protein